MRTRHKGAWTIEENAILHAHYRELGLAGVRTLLPNRTSNAIRKQANNLGVTNWELNCEQNKDPGWPLPACDLIESLANVRLRKWAPQVNRNPRFGVAMIGGGYVSA